MVLSATLIFIAITVLISWPAFNNQALLGKLMMNPYLIATRNQYYRFVTSGFIHRDLQHLFFNMFSFYFFGAVVERDFHYLFGDLGIPYFSLLYIIAIVVSDLPTYFKQKHNPGYNSLGASGGVSAIIFAFILLHPLEKINLYFIISIPGFILGVLYVAYSWYEGKKSRGSINHDAHLYGAFFGILFIAVMVPSSIPRFFQQLAGWLGSF